MKRTKIICTIGPSSEKKTILIKMAKAGMNIARLNFSHGTHKSHRALIKSIRSISKKSNFPIGILQDLQGPKIRFANLPERGVEVKASQKIILVTKESEADYESKIKKIPVGFKTLYKYCKKNDRIFFDDALIEAKITKIANSQIEAKIKNSGIIKSHKGINLPDATKAIASLTTKDLHDLEFGIKHKVDFVALSFVQNAKDIKNLNNHIKKLSQKFKNNHQPKIIAKIEKNQALQNIDKIISASDALLIARGDLGIETPLQDVPIHQKDIIKKSMIAKKPVIVATQMLESMIKNPRPTRAEVSDVANAVIDHADALMLSAETAVGKYPIDATKTMKKVILETEHSPYDDLNQEEEASEEQSVAFAAVQIAKQENANAIILSPSMRNISRHVSSFRPEVPIIVPYEDTVDSRQNLISWGIFPITIKNKTTKKIISYCRQKKIIPKKGKVVIIELDNTNNSTIKIIKHKK